MTESATLKSLIDTDAVESVVGDTQGFPEGAGVEVTWAGEDAVRIITKFSKGVVYDFRLLRVPAALVTGPEAITARMGRPGEDDLVQLTVTPLWQPEGPAGPVGLAVRGEGGGPVQLSALVSASGAPLTTAYLAQTLGRTLNGGQISQGLALVTLTTIAAVVNLVRKEDESLEGVAKPWEYGVGEYRRLITEWGWAPDATEAAPEEAKAGSAEAEEPSNGVAAEAQAVAP